MRINEIYYALSGEGVHVGVPTTIVRTQGCNLRCIWCDTKDAQDVLGGLDLDVKSIVGKSFWPRWALITGGEPLLQSGEVHELIRALKHKGVSVEVETNGSIAPPSWWREVNCWSVDIKCLSSGVCYQSKGDWLGLRECDQLKFVVTNELDLEFACKTFTPLARLRATILISPAYPWTNEWLRRCVEFCKQYGVRLSLQQHKIIFGNEKGV